MALSVLITQCLQRDFVGPLRPHEPLPNRLHVGQAEAQRLLGADPAGGPVAQVLAWARARPPEQLVLVHVRDWHDPDDPRQRDHLEAFGPHCLRGTPGAALVCGLDDALGRREAEHVVDSTSLNDFEGTELPALLGRLRSRAGEALRVGVIGAWTDAKVSFLLYDLKTRLGVDELATCSALTASSSRTQHFNALEQLRRLLGVRVFDSPGEFAAWLVPEAALGLPPGPPVRCEPRLEVEEGPALVPADRDLVDFLYRDSAKVGLHALAGGFSGAAVYRVAAVDALGHRQAPSVLKLGPQRLIAQERVAFERVEQILGNNAPAVRGYADLGERAGLKYSFAAMGQGRVETFKSLWEAGLPPERAVSILREVLEEVLGPFYAASVYERLPLLDYYGFSPARAADVRRAVGALLGPRGGEPALAFPGGRELANVERFYAHALEHEPLPRNDFHQVSWVHGDLNAANILLDARRNVWVIDWFHAARGHVLRDVAKLENDLLYVLTPLASRDELAQALALTDALRGVQDLRAPLPAQPEGVTAPALLRAWSALHTLRFVAGRLCREDRDAGQLDVALLRYAVHTLSFDESSPLQKEWALAAACGYAEDIVRQARADNVLRVDWVDAKLLPGGRLGLTLCPGRRDHRRDLDADLDELKRVGATHVLCLLGDDELEWAGVPRLGEEAQARGLVFRRLPIKDGGVPALEEARALVGWCLDAAGSGGSVVVHCMGGLGRSGTVAACALVARGLDPREAIEEVRRARSPRAVENRDQEDFVEFYAEREGAR